MKKALIICLTLCLVCGFIGCNKAVGDADIHTDYDGVYLTFELLEEEDEIRIFNVTWHNETKYEVTYEEWFTIEYKRGDEWTETNIADVYFAEATHLLKANSTANKEYSTKFFDVSQNGTYRLRTNCTVYDGNKTVCNTWIEFEVKNDSNAKKYNVTMNDPDWLYEPLAEKYSAGEDVIVKIEMAYDLGTMLFVNGELVEMETWNSEENYWQYRFKMPEKDTVIDFKTYDGFLPHGNYGDLIETYWIQNPYADYVSVRTYYGEYESGAIVAMIDSGDYTDALWSETVGESVFDYNNGNRIRVLFDNVFYTLPEVFEKGYLTERDLANIADIHNGGNGIRHKFEYIGRFIYDGLKEYYYPDDEITIRVVAAKGYEMSLFINEKEIEGGVLNESEGYTEYKFIMPDEDVFCEVKDEQIAE